MKDMPSWLQETLLPEDQKTPVPKVEPEAKELREEPKKEVRALSVSQLTKQIKTRLEQDFSELWVKGEISNFTHHRSGHFYFSLKDDKSQVSVVMFRGFNSKLNFQPENGMEVVIKGKISVYEPRGNYQIMCQFMEPVGAGALQKAFEQLKAKLNKEGLFDKSIKKAIPKFPKKVAIITSPTGAAIRDMLNVLSRRSRGLEVLLIPVSVQGEGAAPKIVDAFKKLDAIKDIDVVICGRGGGSTEDLWAFNEEIVARAIFDCPYPVVSAVGHEIDFTISDFVSDMRAPTPSAAAELIVANFDDILQKVEFLKTRLSSYFQKHLEGIQSELYSLKRRLISPEKYLQQQSQRLDDLENQMLYKFKNLLGFHKKNISLLKHRLKSPLDRIERSQEKVYHFKNQLQRLEKNKITENQKDLRSLMAMLDSLSPLKVMERGYSITFKDDKVVKRAKQLKTNDAIEIKFYDKKIKAKITKD